MRRPSVTHDGKFAEAHPILWRVVHGWLGVGDVVQATESEEKADRFGTGVFTVPDPLGPTQLVPYSPNRRYLTLIVDELSNPIVLLTAKTDKVATGFTMSPGKLTMKCRGALWATTTSGTSTVRVLETFDSHEMKRVA